MQRSFSHILLITWLIILAGCKTNYTNTHVRSTNIIVSATNNPVDSQVVKVYLPYKKMLDDEMSKIISLNSEELVKAKPESGLTNFLADLLLDEARFISDSLGFSFNPNISYFNYGGIRTYLPEENITVGKIYELMPFENHVVFLKLSGKQLKIFLNKIAENGGDSLGGVRFLISGNKAKNVVVNGQPINEQTNYWLVTNDYVASGGDNMDILQQALEKVPTDLKIRDVIISYLAKLHVKGEKISAQTDGRIRYE